MNKDQKEILERILGELEEIKDQEQDKFDNMPENLQNSVKGEQFQNGADKLDEAISAINEAMEGY